MHLSAAVCSTVELRTIRGSAKLQLTETEPREMVALSAAHRSLWQDGAKEMSARVESLIYKLGTSIRNRD